MVSTMSVRMKLSDFINTDNEVEIMEIINKTHKDLRAVIFLHLWYNEGEIDTVDLRDFLVRWENKLFFKTKVKQDSDVPHGEFIFYDIIPVNVEKTDRYRFAFTYDNKNNIINGLNQLYDCIKFITSEKSKRKQKRNNYED